MGNVYMEASQINYRGGSKKMSVEEAIKAAGTEITPEEKTWIDSIPTLTTGKADNDVIAPEFDSEAGVYAIGDLVMYEGKLYEFTTAHETVGEWDPTEVSEKVVSDEIDTLKSGIANINNALLSPISNANKIAMSDAYMSLHDIGVNNYDFASLAAESHVTWFTNWTDNTNFPVMYGSGVLIPSKDTHQKSIIYTAIGLNGGTVYTNNYNYGTWVGWRQLSFGPIFVGSLVLTPQIDGRLIIPFSTVGVSVRPASVFITLQSKQGFATYDFDASTNNNIEIIAFEREYEAGVGKNTFMPIAANAPIRICIMVYA